MTVKIAILPEVKVQRRIFADAHWQQWEALGEVAVNRISGHPTPELAKSLIENADIAVTSWGCPPLTKEILDCAPRLKAVIHAAGTVKGIVTPELWRRGIRVSSGNGELGKGVAETALGLTIASLKNMWRLTDSTRRGAWSEGKEQVRELYQVTVGVVGAGKAGGHFIKLLNQFHVDVLVFDPGLSAEQARALGATKTGLDELLAASDVVSIHAPAIPSTYRMINAERLALMKEDAILINTARGSIIDEAALLAQLRQGRLFACLDVTDPEPPAADHPLRGLPNCVITPHLAGAVNNGAKRLGQFAIDEVQRLLAGKRLEGEVREEQLSIMA